MFELSFLIKVGERDRERVGVLVTDYRASNYGFISRHCLIFNFNLIHRWEYSLAAVGRTAEIVIFDLLLAELPASGQYDTYQDLIWRRWFT